jgi:excisionase family DNA binding protein
VRVCSERSAHLRSMETSRPATRPVTRPVSGLEPMLSIDELAEYLDKPVRTIYDWRLSGRGPRAVHVGRSLRYRVCDVQAWLDAQLERVPGEPPETGASGEPG